MFTQQQRTFLSLWVPLCVLVICFCLALIGQVWFQNTGLQAITLVLLVSAALFVNISLGIYIFFCARAFWHESNVTSNMVAVAKNDRIFESRQIGKAIVRTPVTGTTLQPMILGLGEQEMPVVRQVSVYANPSADGSTADENLTDGKEYQYVQVMTHGPR